MSDVYRLGNSQRMLVKKRMRPVLVKGEHIAEYRQLCSYAITISIQRSTNLPPEQFRLLATWTFTSTLPFVLYLFYRDLHTKRDREQLRGLPVWNCSTIECNVPPLGLYVVHFLTYIYIHMEEIKFFPWPIQVVRHRRGNSIWNIYGHTYKVGGNLVEFVQLFSYIREVSTSFRLVFSVVLFPFLSSVSNLLAIHNIT